MQSAAIHFRNSYAPFRIAEGKPDAIRGLSAPEGVADRLRLVAFAELQARDLFRYGSERFSGLVPEEWIEAWERFALVEERHAQLLLDRMAELGVDPGGRTVSDKLSQLCRRAEDPVLFLFLLSSAEERGMEAGITLGNQMKTLDPASAAIFAQIAEEEVEHVEMAKAALASHEPKGLQERARELNSLL